MREVEMVNLVCARCEKTFQRKPYKIKKGKLAFCSHECQIRYGIEHLPKRATTTYVCPNCNKPFDAPTSSKKRSGKQHGVFCSKNCYYLYITGKDFSSYVDLTCSVCGKQFKRKASIERVTRKKFAKICCSRRCASLVEHSTDNDLKTRLFYQLSSVLRHSTIEVGEDVTGDYLLELWETQKHRCPYTGDELILKHHRGRGEKLVNQASIDRIDSSKGYIRGNIEFVSLMANYAKNSWTKQALIDFCKGVAENAIRNNT